MLTKMKIALALCASLAGGVAMADGFHGGGEGRTEILQKYDTNKDGKLDATEKAAMKADFQAKRERAQGRDAGQVRHEQGRQARRDRERRDEGRARPPRRSRSSTPTATASSR